ncbi:MAG: hypothetical protein KDB16_11765, partial [Acidimicrobiales bacterium]|nr:hypothetical protein [Acidimicrobiales bacterium]
MVAIHNASGHASWSVVKMTTAHAADMPSHSQGRAFTRRARFADPVGFTDISDFSQAFISQASSRFVAA